MEKLRMNVQGRVHGVGFRYMTKMVADQLGVTGPVKNEDDGSVSITANAPEDIIETFIKKIKDSPSPAGRVTYVDIQEDPLLEETEQFKVIQ